MTFLLPPGIKGLMLTWRKFYAYGCLLWTVSVWWNTICRQITAITRLRLGLRHLKDHKFKFDCLNLICCCGKDVETTVHYLLHCPIFSDERSIFLINIRSIDENVLSGSDSRISETLLFGISSFKDTKKTSILNTTIDYNLSPKTFDVPLTNFWLFFNISSLKTWLSSLKTLLFKCQIVY